MIRKHLIAAGIRTDSPEKVAVCTRASADQNETVMLDVVNQQSARMNVTFPEPGKVSDPIMIAIFRRQRLPVLQHLIDIGQVLQIQTAPQENRAR